LLPDRRRSLRWWRLTFDKNGRQVKTMAAESLTVGDSLAGYSAAGNVLTAAADPKAELAGTVTTKVGDLTATARVRTYPQTDTWEWDFEGYKGIKVPATWNRAHIKVKPFDLDGNTVMKVTGGPEAKGRPSHQISIGPQKMKNYQMQMDVRFVEERRQLGSLGLSINRYNLILQGNRGKLTVQSWPPHLRMAKSISYLSDPDVWYTIKMKVDANESEAKIFGKVWKTGEAEPAEWMLQQTDPHPNLNGSPGVYFYAQADCYFDNVKVFLTPDSQN